ncbi:MAG: glycoside hydrolase family 31 protein [Paludibacteraceae bacterium]|nr:glycoside hydrolase family 31 protein [Paludibacteraceae bacterium]
MRRIFLIALSSVCVLTMYAEHWWGFAVGEGHNQPYTTFRSFDMSREDANNQLTPLLISDEGRYIWTDTAVTFSFKDGQPVLPNGIAMQQVKDGTLRGAYMEAMNRYFSPSGLMPDSLFFVRPQYNTWIELMYNQNQADILRYAHAIVDNGLPAGVLMIDDNWQRYYGNFDFKAERFPNPKAMMDELHQLGFKVMVWVCPFVSADSPEGRALAEKGYLLKDKDGNTAILRWWNGASACYDLTNPAALADFVATLRQAQAKYGIDGFKFDAGDNNCYASTDLASTATTVEHCESYARLGLSFPVNEFRACWKMGNQPLVQRLGDKDYSWDAVASLIPQMCVAGLLGYTYACPDMIGGGQWTSFLNIAEDQFDQALIVRSAQIHALMPMMQFSVAPWRILSKENMAIVKQAALLHTQFAPYIYQCAQASARTGEPIVRNMEYQFPHQGLADCKDQFMLGDKYLIAPVVDNRLVREVRLPKGTWRDELGKKYKGGKTYTINAPLARLPYFEKIK